MKKDIDSNSMCLGSMGSLFAFEATETVACEYSSDMRRWRMLAVLWNHIEFFFLSSLSLYLSTRTKVRCDDPIGNACICILKRMHSSWSLRSNPRHSLHLTCVIVDVVSMLGTTAFDWILNGVCKCPTREESCLFVWLFVFRQKDTQLRILEGKLSFYSHFRPEIKKKLCVSIREKSYTTKNWTRIVIITDKAVFGLGPFLAAST